MKHPSAIAFDSLHNRWLLFSQPPLKVFSTSRAGEVVTLLDTVERAAQSTRHWALGWISYEAAPGFDETLDVAPAGDLPLVWFGLFAAPTVLTELPVAPPTPPIQWNPSITQRQFTSALSTIRSRIARGDTYQVNFSFRMRAPAPPDPYALFFSMVREQQGSYSVFLDTGRFVISSASPELFFHRQGSRITCMPMKGTAPRHSSHDADNAAALELQRSLKARAENIMVLDMVRNDLSRIAEPGSVQVDAVCSIERYPHVWQLTSNVRAETTASLGATMTALFPSASITGAPKSSTMRSIAELEDSPRGVYTGALGVITPDNRSWFNVAIRTAVIDRDTSRAEYGVGSGIVWDSHDTEEYEECLLKASAVTGGATAVELFETLLWEPASGIFLRERHLARLSTSAECFGWPLDHEQLHQALDAVVNSLTGSHEPHRLRLVVQPSGCISCTSAPRLPLSTPYTVSVATTPIDSRDYRLYHKTSDRSLYDTATPCDPDAHDVLLWNEREELTESRIANLALSIDGKLYTPPVTSGLLPGCYRAELLAQGLLHERVLHVRDLRSASSVFLLNSLRRLWKVEWVG